MKLLAVLALSGLTVSVSASGVQSGPPAPGPELKKFAVMVGTWKYEGTAEKTALGPAAKVSGTQTGQLIMGGYVLQWTGQENGAFGGIQWGEMDAYDTAAKAYTFYGYQNDGTTWSGTYSIAGSTWKGTSTMVVKGTKYWARSEMVLAADGKSATWTQDLSTDGGKTWVKFQSQKLTKQ